MDYHALPLGQLLAEYRIEKLLGEGGFGLTYLAFDTKFNKKVAIKEYYPESFAFRKEGVTVVPKSASTQDDYRWGSEAFIKEAQIEACYCELMEKSTLRANELLYIYSGLPLWHCRNTLRNN